MTETTSEVTETRPAVRPGWPEIIVGLAAMSLVGYGIPILLFRPLGIDGALSGVLLALLSGAAGMVGFAAALAIRIRSLGPFGVRRTSWTWLLLGLAGGVVALILKIIIMPAMTSLFGLATDTQDTYAQGAGNGPLFVILMMLFLAVITPIGEELLFRGVVTTALLRYGPWIGVIGSSLIFALMHGINAVLLAAVIVGLIAGELRRRSGSIWPGVIVHAVNNSITVVVYAAMGLSG